MALSNKHAFGYGLQTLAHDGTVLDTWFPAPQLGAPPEPFEPHLLPQDIEHLEGTHDITGTESVGIGVVIDLDQPPASVPDAYLRLHLLSHTLVAPNSINLEGLFGVLEIVAWTNLGPVLPSYLESHRIELQRAGAQVSSIDKFPPMLNYVVPDKVRIADASRVRLGAHLAPGTTVMHEGFVNFNAGTAGPGMIEGRVSAGVFVGKGSDLGGGCSTMGTLSGGGNIVISVGEGCLIGANAGIGIPLGDRNTVESGLYITAGTKVALLDADNKLVKVLKARDLAGQPDLLFRRNSQSGAVECKTHKSAIELNEALHAHN